MRPAALAALAAFVVAVAVVGPTAEGRTGGPAVVRDVEAGRHTLRAVGEQQQDTATEASISVNPANPLNAVAVYQAGRVDAGCAQILGYATTFDGGRKWRYGVFPKLTVANGGAHALASDPVVAFGPGNVVYANHLMCGNTNDLAISVSTNGGRTWSAPIMVPVERTLPLDDKNWITVDDAIGPGHHPGRLYLVWDNVAPVIAMYSDDRAKTWNGPFTVWAGQGVGTIPLVMPNGDLAVVFNAVYPVPAVPSTPTVPAPSELFADKLVITTAIRAGSVPTGGPLIFTPPTSVAADLGIDARLQRAGEGLPTAAVDPRTGRIYVSWPDNRLRTDEVNDIVVTHSDDAGLTWSPVARVNRGPNDDFVEHFTPAMAVGRDGIVRIAYRQQRQAPQPEDIPKQTPFVDTYYQHSRDGVRFGAPLKVNRRVRTDMRFAAFSRGSAFLGDYAGVAVNGSWAYVVRAEAYRLSKREPAAWPPLVHHQRIWVAVVDSDGNGRP